MKKVRIIIAEDEFVFGLNLRHSLEGCSYEIIDVVTTGEEAVETALRTEPDIILMDIILAGDMDGIEAVSRIRESLRVPFIYMTANADRGTIDRARRTEPYGFLNKPINMSDLYSTIDFALQRHHLMQLLEESKERYRGLIEKINDVIFTIDQNEIITYVSPVVTDVGGYEPAEVVGKSCVDFLCRDDIPAVRTHMKNLRGGFNARFECRFVTKGGSLKWVRASVRPLFTGETYGGVNGILTDITREKRAEDIFRKTFTANPMPMAISRITTGEFLEVNEAFLRYLSYSREDVLGRRSVDLGLYADNSARDAIISEVMGKGALREKELEVCTKDGRKRTGLFTADTIELEGERFLISCIQDITDYRAAEYELEAALLESERRRELLERLLAGARKVLEQNDFTETARLMYDACRKLTGATSGYMGLLSPDGKSFNIIFIDHGGTVNLADPVLSMPVRGLSSLACAEKRVVCENRTGAMDIMLYMPDGRGQLLNLMFAPLVIDGSAVGIMAMVNKPVDFNERDLILAGSFSEMASVALKNACLKKEQECMLAALRDSEGKFRAAIDASLDPIIAFDDSGMIKIFNRAAEFVFGYAREEVLDRPLTVICPSGMQAIRGGDAGMPPAPARSVLESGGTWKQAFRKKDGSFFSGAVSVSFGNREHDSLLVVFIRQTSWPMDDGPDRAVC